MIPGEQILASQPIELYRGRASTTIEVENISSDAIWVSSHYPFFEVNKRLRFRRADAWGRHLEIPAGDCLCWRPHETRRVRLVDFGGPRLIRGFNGLTEGPATSKRLRGGLRRMREAGVLDAVRTNKT